MSWLKTAALLMMTTVLFACGEPEEKVPTDPEDVALAFFTAIYVDDNVEKALEVSGPDLQDLLSHYRNVTAIKRHVIGMEIESPDIQVKNSSADFFRKLTDDVEVELHFSAYIDGRVYKDVRFVIVSQEFQGQWVVKKVVADPFASNG
ncbi:hypothetical protein [Echinimonas agarilytica]|uniref:DUF4878 domain-containing protein n=1 Tax=Echinimonas agarilytica TaxID=1215918 RepID=A0AA41W6B6_9GAMM|nr:hypothetical protein [Echinimonas agarilytica]MCM2679333.1 hypothetical protein [Echinimonas agarilytica]